MSYGARRARLGRVGSLFVLLSVLLLAGAGVVYLAAPALGANPVVYDDWGPPKDAAVECAKVGTFAYAYKVDAAAPNGSWTHAGNTITILNSDGKVFDWSATSGIGAVIVKAGTGANVWFYSPQATSDARLYAYQNKDVSHVTFCWNDTPTLTLSKTANTTYTRTYTWTISKAVSPSSHSGAPGDSFSSDYDVVVDQTVVDSNWAVSGSITIANNTSTAATIESVTDSISGVGAVLVTCPQVLPYSVPAGQQLVCTYTNSLPNADSRTNTATVTTSGAVSGGTATASVAFGAPTTVVGYSTINVTDSVQGGLGSASGDKTFEYTRPFACPEMGTQYVNGVYTHSFPNTATITETGQFDDANVDLRCTYDPELRVSKTANPTYSRTYTWTISKAVSPSSHSGAPGDSFSSDYDVVVDQTVLDSGFAVHGNIVISNPTGAAVDFSVADSVGGTTASVTCPSYTVAAGGSVTCTYSVGLAGKVNGTNTATVTSLTAGVAGGTATADYVFGDPTTVIGHPTINVTDSVQGALGSASGDKTFEYSDGFLCPRDTSNYVNGVYSYNVPNTATITETGQFDDANVQVYCSYEVPGRIIVRKVVLPDDAPPRTFAFDSSWATNFNLADGESHDSGLLPAGVYSVSEVMPLGEGWSLTSASCSDGSSPSAIGLSPQETVTCTFVNTFQETEGPKGSLTIIKVVNGVVNPADAGALFSFLGGSLGDFDLADGDSEVFSELDAGAYTVGEGDLPISANPTPPPAGSIGYLWHFESVNCTAQDWAADGQSVTVNLAEGEAAVCTFYNYQETVAGPELPYTGPDEYLLPLLIGGLWALLMGLGLVVWSAMRRAEAA